MDRQLYLIVGILVLGLAFGFFRKKPITEAKIHSGWWGFIVLGVLIVGMGFFHDWGMYFGIALMIVVPIMFIFSVGSSIGALFKPTKDKIETTQLKRTQKFRIWFIVFVLVLFVIFPTIATMFVSR